MQLQIRFVESEDRDPESVVAKFSRTCACSRDRAAVDLVQALASGCAGLARALADKDLLALAGCAQALQNTAAAAGLERLDRAARAVVHCASGQDQVALSATVARCRRLAEMTVSALWTAGQGVE